MSFRGSFRPATVLGSLPSQADDSERRGTATDHLHAAGTHICLALDAVRCSLWPPREHAAAEDELQAEFRVIYPDDPWKKRWDMLMLLLIIYSAALVPVRVAFHAEAEGWWFVFELSLSIAFMTDVAFSFRTAFLFESGDQWETRQWPIAQRYLSGWFWVDAPSAVPCELIELTLTGAVTLAGSLGLGGVGSSALVTDLSSFRLLRMFRLVRMLKLLRVEDYVRLLEDTFDINGRVLRLFALVFKMLLVAHVAGCGWFYLVWFANGDAHWVNAFDERIHGEVGVTMDGPVSDQYMISVYWALVTLTTVGYGDITPTNPLETLYASFAVITGALCFAYIVGDIGALIVSMDKQAAVQEEKIGALKEYLAWRGVPRELSLRTRRYYEHYYRHKDIFDEAEILDNLNPRLNQEIVTFILKDTLGKLPLFKTLSRDFQIKCFPKLRPGRFKPGEIIFNRGEVPDDLYFLVRGEVEITSRFDEKVLMARLTPTREIKLDRDGSETSSSEFTGCFGQAMLLGRRHANTHRAGKDVEVLVIRRDDFEELLNADPRSTRLILKTVLKDYERKDRLEHTVAYFQMTALPWGELRAALLMQIQWRRYVASRALNTSTIFALVNEAKSEAAVRRSSLLTMDMVSRPSTRGIGGRVSERELDDEDADPSFTA